MSHTPGPWVATREAHGWDVSTVDYVVAECGSDVGALENARLIAAAPDLLHELKHLVLVLGPYTDHIFVPGRATLNAAEAAIARAEGK